MMSRNMDRLELLALSAGLALGAAPMASLAKERRPARFDWTLHRPEAAGISRVGLEAVRAAVRKHLDAQEQLGAVTAIARHNKLVLYEAQGTRDPAGTPMRKDDIFRMMSSTKHVTAVAVLMLLDDGKLALDDKVSRFIPSFRNPRVASEMPAGWQAAVANPALRVEMIAKAKLVPAAREITVKDLLTHTSGLMSARIEGPMPSALLSPEGTPKPGDALAPYAERLGPTILDFQPGSRWSYSPLAGIDVLLRIVEIVSRQPGDVFLRERIFEPLEMRDTYFTVPPEKEARIVPLYQRKDGAWRTATPLLGNGAALKYVSGAGGLFSTAHDFLQLEQMLLNKRELNGRRLLKSETVALMSKNHVGGLFAAWFPLVTAGMGFGLGVGVTLDPEVAGSGRNRGAFGWGGAYGTESWVDPDADMTAAYFVQQPVRTALVDFQKAVRGAIVA